VSSFAAKKKKGFVNCKGEYNRLILNYLSKRNLTGRLVEKGSTGGDVLGSSHRFMSDCSVLPNAPSPAKGPGGIPFKEGQAY